MVSASLCHAISENGLPIRDSSNKNSQSPSSFVFYLLLVSLSVVGTSTSVVGNSIGSDSFRILMRLKTRDSAGKIEP